MTPAEIVVVSGSYGAGHDAAADALADQLRAGGHVVARLDVADELPLRIGMALRWLYLVQLRLLPGSWGATLRWLERDGAGFRATRRLLGLLGRRLVGRVSGAHLVVSTHPFASQALGEARAAGRLQCPVVTYLTDASVHRLWVHPAVDLHLAIHAVTARQAAELDGRVATVTPVVARSRTAVPGSWQPPWPPGRPVALVVGGSCGVGDLAVAALDLLDTGVMTPVVACGTNDRLRDQLAQVPGLVSLGWREDLPELLAAATCVVQNAGGMTALQALAAGTPTLTYRPIPGHGTTNAQALDAAGLVPWVPDAEHLRRALADVLGSPRRSRPQGLPVTVLDVLTDHLLLEPWTASAGASGAALVAA